MSTRTPAPTVITAHSNADFDAMASMVAASRLYPGAVLIFPGSQEKNLRNFFIQSAMYMFNFKNPKEVDLSTTTTLVMVDTRQRSRLVHVAPVFDNPGLRVHAYDHHPDSPDPGDDVPFSEGVVEPWGSTAAILVDIIRSRGLALEPDEATVIGLGIYEDTGSFTFSSTTEHDLTAAAWLLAQGMDVAVIADLITRDLSSEQISILNALLESAQTYEIRGVPVVVAEVTTEDYVGDFALLAHKLVDMENIRVLFALGRMHDRVHLVARSRSPEVDVGSICASFGGGGHAFAASASIKDRPLAQVKEELFALLYSHINPQIKVSDLMSRPAIALEKDKTIAQAVELMTRFSLKTLPVLDPANGTCVGLLEHQIADKALAHGLGDLRAAEYMLRDVVSIAPETDLYEVMDLILGHRQPLVPVVDKGRVLGVLTRTDLINILIEEPARIPESLLPERKQERNIRIILKERLPPGMVGLLETAGRLGDEVGCSVYAVGGFVRDILLMTPNLDLDLVVEGDGIAYANALAEATGGRVRPHHKFKTAVVVLPDSRRVDVATARLEYYEYPAALPTVELSSIKMDLYRRDFTINALAVQLNPGQFGRLVDFFGAQRDIKDRQVRVLHSLSFVEDPTRILRAIRFEQRYNFAIGGQTERLIKNALQLDMLGKLSGSRLFHELKLMLEEKKAVACIKRMRHFRILRAIHPSLILKPFMELLLDEVDKVLGWYRLLYLEPKARSWLLYFLVLANGFSEDEESALLIRLNLTERLRREFSQLRRQLSDVLYRLKTWRFRKGSPAELFDVLESVPVEGVLYLMAKSRDEDMRKHLSKFLTKYRDQAPDITGKDLLAMGVDPGPLYGLILRKVRAAYLDGEAPCRTDQLELARKLAQDPAWAGIDDLRTRGEP